MQIDIKAITKVQSLDLSNKKIRFINLRDYRWLKDIWLHDNKISEIDLKSNIFLERLWLNENKLRSICLLNNRYLNWLDLQFNFLVKIELTLSDNVSEERYMSCFSFFNQQS